jgi:ATP-dependent helicase/nuclease subunit A
VAEVAWTTSQRAAIDEVGCSVLVSAGAGSGKTAVLSERCAHLVADVVPPCPVDQLLVVTFTEAAAAQMRHRIEAALRQRLAEGSSPDWLRRQLALVETASISTIHAFCRQVLQRYFSLARLDPRAPILDANEAALLRHETARRLFDARADGADERAEALHALVRSYGGGWDEGLIGQVLELDAFLESLPRRSEWLADCLRRWEPGGDGVPEFWLRQFVAAMADELEAQARSAEDAAAALRRRTGDFAGKFADAVAGYREQVGRWLGRLQAEPTAATVDALCAEMGEYKLAKPVRRDTRKIPPGELDNFDLCDAVFKGVQEKLARDRMRRLYGGFNRAEVAEGMARAAPHVRTLVDLVEEFHRAYQSAKADLGVIDFADLERMTLDLLEDESNGVAGRLRRRYRFVLVDEFQDVNPMQAAILAQVSREGRPEGEGNLFSVGDVKQSIYRFRLAEPKLFLRRRKRFLNEGGGRVIDLLENFRSSRGVIDAINGVFERLMSADLGGIDYDEHARLKHARPGGDEDAAPALELHVLEDQAPVAAAAADHGGEEAGDEPPGGEDWERIEREAYVIAMRIEALVREGRPCRDIVILMRSMRQRSALFVRTLARLGIPAVTETSGGLFEAMEVVDVLSLLAVLDNAQQDIPLCGVLRSPLFGAPLNDEDLARLCAGERAKDGGLPFHAVVRRYARNGTDRDLRGRLSGVLDRLRAWRERVRRRPLADVLWQIYEESGCLAHVAGMREGPQRRSNLVRLHEYARQFGTFGRQGLHRFLRFVDGLREANEDLQAGSVAASEEVVRVMTIHASKGLEFPVVILAELGKRWNLEDSRGSILLDRRLGLALKAVDLDRRIVYPTLPHRLVEESLRHEALAEEMRVLYVALTRAREKLILVGSGALAPLEEMSRRLSGRGPGPLPLLDRQAARNCLDWVWPAVHGDEGEPGRRYRVELYRADQMREWSFERPATEASARLLDACARLEPLPPPAAGQGAAVVEQVRRRLGFAYPARVLTRVPAVAAASELKRRWDGRMDEGEPAARWPVGAARGYELRRPCSAGPGDIRPEERGTWTHSMLQQIDLSAPCDLRSLEARLRGLVTAGKLDPRAQAAINLPALAWFFETEEGRRLRRPGTKVLREWPFVFGVPPQRYDRAARAVDAGDFVLVRGIIDCLFDAGDGWELIDYKTDEVEGPALVARAEEYRGQVEIYAEAVRAAWQRPVLASHLVFLAARRVVSV